MRYDEKLKGYQALLAELESGLDANPLFLRVDKYTHREFWTTKTTGSCPEWVYEFAGCNGGKEARMAFVRSILSNGILFDGFTPEASDELRINAIEWVKARISEGPPKPKLKWEEAHAKNASPIRFCASAAMGTQTIVLIAGADAQQGRWYYYIAACYTDSPKEWQLDVNRLLWEDQASGIPDGGYPAPFLEAEEALHNLLSAALDALNNPKP